MTQKSIKIQTQRTALDNVTDIKHIAWCAINVDDIRIVIDAFNGQRPEPQPRLDSFLQVVTDKEVFELTPETLVEVLRFWCDYSAQQNIVNRYKNRQYLVMPDEYRKAAKKANL